MIKDDIKPCCIECKNADIKVNNEYYKSDTYKDCFHIYCAHQGVCRYYIDDVKRNLPPDPLKSEFRIGRPF